MTTLKVMRLICALGLMAMVSACSDPEPLAYSIDRVEVYMVNVNVGARIESLDPHSRLIAPALGHALGEVADRVRAGAIKITPETQYVQVALAIKGEGDAQDVGTFRVPVGSLAEIQDVAVANLEAVDLIEDGTGGIGLEPMKRYCMGSEAQAANPKFCALVGAA